MDNDELRDWPHQLAREEQETVRPADLNVPLSDETGNDYQPLSCECGADMLKTGNGGNFVWVMNPDQAATIGRVAAYWACWECEKKIRADLYVAGYATDWKGIEELLNPLEHKRWNDLFSRLIDQGKVSESAAAKMREFKNIVAPLVDREPTEQDIVRFEQLRWVDGL